VIIIDASIAVMWIAPEAASGAATDLLNRQDLAAPDLIAIEVGNAMRRKVVREEITREQAREGLNLVEARVVLCRTDFRVLDRSLEMALAIGHPIYDCVYLALAERNQSILVTGDLQLINRAKPAGLGQLVSGLPFQ
jgi:predicted nucleic acid-binding protein